MPHDIYAAPQQQLGANAASSTWNKTQIATLTKFAWRLSGARHFKVPLYTIEGHLLARLMNQRGSWTTGRQGAALPRTIG
jgi:hypothetical protein